MASEKMLPHEHAELKNLDKKLREGKLLKRPYQGLFQEIQNLAKENEKVLQDLRQNLQKALPESDESQLSLLPEPEQLSLFAVSG